MTMLKGKVAKVLDSRTLAANIGEEDGVEADMTFEIYTTTGKITDPDSNEVISEGEDLTKATVVPKKITEKMTVMKTQETFHRLSLDNLTGLGTIKQENMKIDDYTPDDIMVVERGDPIRQIDGESEDS